MMHCHWTAHVHSALSESLLGTDPQHQLTKRQNSTLIFASYSKQAVDANTHRTNDVCSEAESISYLSHQMDFTCLIFQQHKFDFFH